MNAQPYAAPANRSTAVRSLDALRIERALANRQRYRYVHPRIVAEACGWKVVSPNCSRNIDPAGGEIEICWLCPVGPTRGSEWQLHARDDGAARWRLSRQGPLHELLKLLCADPAREFWR